MTPEEKFELTLKQLRAHQPAPLICGMIPWMFWSLLGVILFFVFGPFLVTLFR